MALYTPFIKRHLGLRQVAESDQDDLCQEILLTLLKEVPRFEHSQRTGAFRAWLRELVHHRTLTYWRSRQGSKVLAIDPQTLAHISDPLDPLAQQWDDEHDGYVLDRLLELLEGEFTATTWRAFLLQVLHHRPPTEVAQELGLSVNAVVIAKSRVLRRLREEAQGLVE